MTSGCDFGNARVRARRSALLTGDRYRELAALDIERLLAALSDTPYRPDLEQASPRHRGQRLLEEATRTNLAHSLREVVGWYDGPAAADLGLVLERWDVRNLRTLLRGQFARGEPEDIRAALVPAGRLGDDVLGELAVQAGLRPTVELMFSWGIPQQRVAAAALAALAELEDTGDYQAFERAFERAAAHRLEKAVDRADPAVATALRLEIDQINLMTALRLHQSRAGADDRDAVEPAERFLDGGALSMALLAAVARAPDRADAGELLARASMPPRWSPPLARWAESGDLEALADELDEAVVRSVTGMFAGADPLGPGIPLAYMWAKENEVKNLRTIGAGAVAGLAADAIEEELVIL